jgi:hypothetical protein
VVVEIMCASIAADVVALFSRAAIASRCRRFEIYTHHFHRYTPTHALTTSNAAVAFLVIVLVIGFLRDWS